MYLIDFLKFMDELALHLRVGIVSGVVAGLLIIFSETVVKQLGWEDNPILLMFVACALVIIVLYFAFGSKRGFFSRFMKCGERWQLYMSILFLAAMGIFVGLLIYDYALELVCDVQERYKLRAQFGMMLTTLFGAFFLYFLGKVFKK